jgi:SAM-dependent methyltransferase
MVTGQHPRDHLSSLDRLNWDFDEYDTTASFARLHWYPATFVPQLPRALIETLSSVGDLVLDPFCGSGTVTTEAARVGRPVIGVDINPIARLITQARLELTFADLTFPDRLLSASNAVTECVRGTRTFDEFDTPPFNKVVSPCRAEELALWYHQDTYRELNVLMSAIDAVTEPDVRRVLLAIASSVTRALSSQTKSWGHIADNVRPATCAYKPVDGYFRRAVAMTMRSLLTGDRLDTAAQPGSWSVVQGDARAIPVASECIDLVVTSFPYPGMSDYTLAQRLSLMWLGLDPEPLLATEIGARRKRFRRRWLDEFAEEMRCSLQEIARALRPGGHLAIVSPLYHKEDPRVATMADIVDSVAELGFAELKRLKRIVPARRKRQSWGTLQRELITIWRRS